MRDRWPVGNKMEKAGGLGAVEGAARGRRGQKMRTFGDEAPSPGAWWVTGDPARGCGCSKDAKRWGLQVLSQGKKSFPFPHIHVRRWTSTELWWLLAAHRARPGAVSKTLKGRGRSLPCGRVHTETQQLERNRTGRGAVSGRRGRTPPQLRPHALSPAGQFPLDLFQLGAEMKVGGTPSPR